MPCNTIQRSKVEFLATSTDLALLTDALRSRGYSTLAPEKELVVFRTPYGIGSYHKETGKLIVPQACDVNGIKRAYSEQVVQSQAAKHGWKIAWSTNVQGHRQAMVQRRG